MKFALHTLDGWRRTTFFALVLCVLAEPTASAAQQQDLLQGIERQTTLLTMLKRSLFAAHAADATEIAEAALARAKKSRRSKNAVVGRRALAIAVAANTLADRQIAKVKAQQALTRSKASAALAVKRLDKTRKALNEARAATPTSGAGK